MKTGGTALWPAKPKSFGHRRQFGRLIPPRPFQFNKADKEGQQEKEKDDAEERVVGIAIGLYSCDYSYTRRSTASRHDDFYNNGFLILLDSSSHRAKPFESVDFIHLINWASTIVRSITNTRCLHHPNYI